jgi:C4-dicarboxylate transporter DctQ subunit
MCFRFLQVLVSFNRTGELPHVDHGHVEGLDEDTATDPIVGPGNKKEDTPWFQNTEGLYPKEVNKNQDSDQKEGGAK